MNGETFPVEFSATAPMGRCSTQKDKGHSLFCYRSTFLVRKSANMSRLAAMATKQKHAAIVGQDDDDWIGWVGKVRLQCTPSACDLARQPRSRELKIFFTEIHDE
ncbi:MAG: hypothetical protein WCZ18_02945 [Ottowia sp.]|nr:hypothetical protein [Ottowia sp.]